MVYIYILLLKNNKYYVGKPTTPNFSINYNFNLNNSKWTNNLNDDEWTIKYKPVKVLKVIPDCDNFDEDKYTIMYMNKYGIENVRGGSFCELNLTLQNKTIIQKMLQTTSDVCFKSDTKEDYIIESDSYDQNNNEINEKYVNTFRMKVTVPYWERPENIEKLKERLPDWCYWF